MGVWPKCKEYRVSNTLSCMWVTRVAPNPEGRRGRLEIVAESWKPFEHLSQLTLRKAHLQNVFTATPTLMFVEVTGYLRTARFSYKVTPLLNKINSKGFHDSSEKQLPSTKLHCVLKCHNGKCKQLHFLPARFILQREIV